VALAAFVLTTVRPALAARAEWLPRGVLRTTATLSDVLATNARASGSAGAPVAHRRERWTYAAGTRRIAVTVDVNGDDFRTSLELDGLTYTAGRTAGARWRGDGNGIVHGVEADLQGDALDRAPQAIFPLDLATCTLVGEARLAAPAWVIQTSRPGDKAAFLYVDEATGSIEPAPLAAGGTSFPQRRTFAAAEPLVRSATLDASFNGVRIKVGVNIAGRRHWFVLDTGTTSITVDPSVANNNGGSTLGHAVLPQVGVGPYQLDRVSVLTVAFGGGGILGLEFFFGDVIEIDYRRERVRVVCADEAHTIFADPKTTIIAANVDRGLPLVHAGFGPAQGDDFAIDTGSPRLYVLAPFMTQFASEIAAHWTRAGSPYVERYLEGGIEVQPYRVARFEFANAEGHQLIVGGQVPTSRTDDLAIPFDGIIGTDILQSFDLYFDYDGGRLGIRQKPA
jgi:hypothetical protein